MGMCTDAILFYGVSIDPEEVILPCEGPYELEDYIKKEFGFNYLDLLDFGISYHCSSECPIVYLYCTLEDAPHQKAYRGHPIVPRMPPITKELLEWDIKITDFIQHLLRGDTDKVSPVNWYLASDWS